MKKISPKPGIDIGMTKVFRSGVKKKMSDTIPSELLLQVYLNEKKVCTISCLPLDLSLLAVGHVINQGYVKDFGSIEYVRECDEIIEKGLLWSKVEVRSGHVAGDLTQPGFLPSGCGNIDDFILKKKLQKIPLASKVSTQTLLGLNSKALKSQELKKKFGGLHSASLFEFSGRHVFISEDIGRHNCIDKIAGHIHINNLKTDDKIIYTTGRLSLDAIYNLNKMGIPVAVTNSSVTYTAADLAEKLNMTVIGYARGGRINLYTGLERIG